MGSKSRSSGGGKREYDRNSYEYRQKRQKNNDAVKRSRDKSKQKAQESSQRVQKLQMENENLRATLDNMQQELKFLKEMLVSQAGNSDFLTPELEKDLEELLREDGPSQNPQRVTHLLTEVKRLQHIHEQQQQIHLGNELKPPTGMDNNMLLQQHGGNGNNNNNGIIDYDPHFSYIDYQQFQNFIENITGGFSFFGGGRRFQQGGYLDASEIQNMVRHTYQPQLTLFLDSKSKF